MTELREKIADWIPAEDENYRLYVANQILTLIKEHNYVRLSDVQSLPERPFYENKSLQLEAQRDMLKANFRRVELLKEASNED